MTYDEWRESYCSEPLFNEAMARAAWEAATAQEREACAKVADAQRSNTNVLLSYPPQSSAAYNIGIAIRARKES